MPELPEVETVCRGIAPVLTGQRITRVLQRRADLRIPFPPDFRDRLEGRQVTGVTRRAKYILVTLDNGDILVIHLGMSGHIKILTPGGAGTPGHAPNHEFGPHDHVIFYTGNDARLLYHDPRRFGLMTIVQGGDITAHPLFQGLGPEPLGNGFSGPVLSAALAGRKSPIKTALLDQRVVAGLGNIYVCEALYRAGISPKRTAATVAGVRAGRLADAIRQVLREAIEAGGSTLRNYARVNGELGYFQHRFLVYGCEGKACRTPGCKGFVKRLVQSNRSTFYCSVCQR